jgi:hypothetical protein
MTIDSHSVARIDFSDPNFTYGRQPLAGTNLSLRTPTNNQSSVARLKRFVDGAAQLIP